MQLEELERLQRTNSRAAHAAAMGMLSTIQAQEVPEGLWLTILRLLWQALLPNFESSARNSRSFFDSQRESVLGDVDLKPVNLSSVSYERFVYDMSPFRELMAGPDTPVEVLSNAALRAVRTVENVGRRQMIRAVSEPDEVFDSIVAEDQFSQKRRFVQGWARVATGRETCGWCLMLVSRGPVYRHDTAGSRLSFTETLTEYARGTLDPEKHLNQWHTGCDCKLVPVFDLNAEWEGKSRFRAAEELWKRSTIGYSGQDAVNAFRRAVENGEFKRLLDASQGRAA